MAYSAEAQAFISLLQDRPVAFHPRLARAFGSVNTGLWLSQLMYWDGKGTKHEDGWLEKKAQDFEEETALSEREQETARSVCIIAGVIEYERRGLPAMPCYRIKWDDLVAKLSQDGDNSRLGRRHGDGRQTPINMGASQGIQDGRQTPLQLSEITSENTNSATEAVTLEPQNAPPDSEPQSEKPLPLFEEAPNLTSPLSAAPDITKTKRSGRKPRTTTENYKPIFGALASVCGMNPTLQATRLGKSAKKFDSIGATAQEIHNVASWWHTNNIWLAEKKKFPSPEDLMGAWDKARGAKPVTKQVVQEVKWEEVVDERGYVTYREIK